MAKKVKLKSLKNKINFSQTFFKYKDLKKILK